MDSCLSLASVISPPAGCAEPYEIVEERPPIDQWAGEWLLAEIPPRLTNQIEAKLEYKGVFVYTPRQIVWRREGVKRRRVLQPLFPGYLAACIFEQDLRHAVRYTDHVWRIIPIVNQARFVKQMAAVQRMLATGEVEVFPELKEGCRVRVKRGHSLWGQEGYLIRRGDRDRFVICVETLGQAVSVEIDAAMLEPV